MIILSILIIIVAIAIPSTYKQLSPILLTRISAIVFIYAGVLSFNAFYIQSIGSGIGIYSGLFHVTQLLEYIETFLCIIVSLILVYHSIIWNNILKRFNSNFDITTPKPLIKNSNFPFYLKKNNQIIDRKSYQVRKYNGYGIKKFRTFYFGDFFSYHSPEIVELKFRWAEQEWKKSVELHYKKSKDLKNKILNMSKTDTLSNSDLSIFRIKFENNDQISLYHIDDLNNFQVAITILKYNPKLRANLLSYHLTYKDLDYNIDYTDLTLDRGIRLEKSWFVLINAEDELNIGRGTNPLELKIEPFYLFFNNEFLLPTVNYLLVNPETIISEHSVSDIPSLTEIIYSENMLKIPFLSYSETLNCPHKSCRALARANNVCKILTDESSFIINNKVYTINKYMLIKSKNIFLEKDFVLKLEVNSKNVKIKNSIIFHPNSIRQNWSLDYLSLVGANGKSIVHFDIKKELKFYPQKKSVKGKVLSIFNSKYLLVLNNIPIYFYFKQCPIDLNSLVEKHNESSNNFLNMYLYPQSNPKPPIFTFVFVLLKTKKGNKDKNSIYLININNLTGKIENYINVKSYNFINLKNNEHLIKKYSIENVKIIDYVLTVLTPELSKGIKNNSPILTQLSINILKKNDLISSYREDKLYNLLTFINRKNLNFKIDMFNINISYPHQHYIKDFLLVYNQDPYTTIEKLIDNHNSLVQSRIRSIKKF